MSTNWCNGTLLPYSSMDRSNLESSYMNTWALSGLHFEFKGNLYLT